MRSNSLGLGCAVNEWKIAVATKPGSKNVSIVTTSLDAQFMLLLLYTVHFQRFH